MKVRAHDDPKVELIDPSSPITKVEREVFGQNTYRLKKSGWCVQFGSGALSPERQDEMALWLIEMDTRRPLPIDVKEFSRRPLGAPRTDPPWSYDKGDAK